MANIEQQVTKLMAEEIIRAIKKITEDNNRQYVNNQIKNYKMTSSNVSADLYARFADIAVLEAQSATIDTAQIENLYATVADFVYLAADKAQLGDVEAQKIVTAIADMGLANIGSADIGWAQIKDLVSGTAIIHEGINGKLYVDRLAVTEANMVSLTVGELVVKGSDGNFYSLVVDEDGNISTEVKQVTGDNIANNTISGGNIIENTITARELNVSKIFADEALIRAVKAANIDVDDLFANNAFVNKLTTYLIQDPSFSSQIVMTDSAIGAISENIQLEANQTFTSTVSSLNSSIVAAQESSNKNAVELANVIKKYDAEFEDLKGQIDGTITNWFYSGEPTLSNQPANEWTTDELKESHIGDMYYDIDTNYAYRFLYIDGVYQWSRIADTDVAEALQAANKAQDTADSKRRIFFEQPIPPYDQGDVWTQGTNGDILRCQIAKASGQLFDINDWVLASKYTDDTVANSALNTAKENQNLINGLTTRVIDAETTIVQTKEEIQLKASRTEVTELSNTVNDNADKISQLEEFTSEIDQKADSISLVVSKKSTAYRQEDEPTSGSVGDTWVNPTTGKQYQNAGACGVNAPGFAFDDDGNLLYAYEDDVQMEYTFVVDDTGDLILNAEGDYYIEDDGDFVGSGEWIEVVSQDFAELVVKVNGITSTVGNMQGEISQVNQTANKIYWIVSSDSSESNMILTDKFLKVVADDIDLSANQTITLSAEQMEVLANNLNLSTNNTIIKIGEDIDAVELAANNAQSSANTANTKIDGMSIKVTNLDGNLSSTTQTANKINWLVASGTSASNMALTSQLIALVSRDITLTAEKINAVASEIVLTTNPSITNLNTSVGVAQSTASQAQSSANAAQSTANQAVSNASTAQSTASQAQSDADNAQKSADNLETEFNRMVRINDEGLHVGDSQTTNEVLIDSNSVNVVIGGDKYSKFADSYVQFGNYKIGLAEDGGLMFRPA